MDFTFIDKTDDRISQIVHSLHFHTLREALVLLCKKKNKKIPKTKNLEQLIESFEELTSTKSEKLSSLFEAESDSPTRHIFLTNYDGTPNFKNCNTEKKYETNVADHPLHFRFLDSRYEKEGLVFAIFDHNWLYEFRKEVTEKNAKKRRWEEDSETRRHSITVCVNTLKKYVSIGYAGFQNGGETYLTGGVVYESLCNKILNITSEEFGIKYQPLNLREIVKHLTGRSTPKFSVDMLDSKYKELELFLRKDSGGKSILEELSSELSSHLKIESTSVLDSFQKIIAQSKVEEAELKWKTPGAKTIIRFLEIGPEMRFSWDKPCYDIVPQLKICNLLAELSVFQTSEKSQSFLTYFNKLKFGDVIDAIQIQQTTGLPPGEVKAAIISAAEMGMLKPVYKINSDKNFIDYTNTWTEKITDLKRTFETIENIKIDGAVLENVKIGFKKVAPNGAKS